MNEVPGFVVCVLLFLAYAGIGKRLSGPWFAASAAALCFGGGVLWRLLVEVSLWRFGLSHGLNLGSGVLFIRGGVMDGTTLGLLSFLYIGIEHWRQATEHREKAHQAMALAQQAQLEMLRYQLNPHFLFNALNSIRGMIVDAPERSRQMITELADFLRYSLDGKGQESTIGSEIQVIESYLAIQRIRFEEQLDATVEVDEAARDVAVPCFLIHPLVENAVKYGMKTSAKPLRVRVEVTCESGEIGIRVSNTGHLVERSGEDDSNGIGLRNIAGRLKLVFPDRHAFQIWESDGWVRAEVRLRVSGETGQHEVTHSTDRR